MDADYKKLDNPVWWALSENHRRFGLAYDAIKFYDPAYCPFGAIGDSENYKAAVSRYSSLTDNFFIVGRRPEVSETLLLKHELVCVQMVLSKNIDLDLTEDVVKLEPQHEKELFRLVNTVQPGYFKTKTFLLGNYFGIFVNNKLVAAAGERMQMKKNIEVSAVVTHPDHRGKGYAGQLIGHTVNKIFDQGKIPFLHVAQTNYRAIELYKKLGFETRRKISFWNFARSK